MTDKYKLVGHEVVPCESLEEWADWYESTFKKDGPSRIVKRTEIGEATVSTVFLSIDYNFFNEGSPILFETMCFWSNNPELNGTQERYSTWEQAEAGHNRMVGLMKAAMGGS